MHEGACPTPSDDRTGMVLEQRWTADPFQACRIELTGLVRVNGRDPPITRLSDIPTPVLHRGGEFN